MIRRDFGGLTLIGAIMMLLGAALLLHLDARTPERVHPRLLVAGAVSNLEHCTTCHSQTQPGTHLVRWENDLPHSARPEPTFPQDVAALPDASVLQAEVDARLADLGQRILAAPQPSSAQAETVSVEFLRLYQTTRAADSATLLGALHDLRLLEQRLIALQGQSAPVRWQLPERPLPRVPLAALQTAAPLAPGLAVLGRLFLPCTTQRIPIPPLEDRVLVLAEMLFVARRCDPPADDACLAVFVPGRLPSIDAQSPFCFRSTGWTAGHFYSDDGFTPVRSAEGGVQANL